MFARIIALNANGRRRESTFAQAVYRASCLKCLASAVEGHALRGPQAVCRKGRVMCPMRRSPARNRGVVIMASILRRRLNICAGPWLSRASSRHLINATRRQARAARPLARHRGMRPREKCTLSGEALACAHQCRLGAAIMRRWYSSSATRRSCSRAAPAAARWLSRRHGGAIGRQACRSMSKKRMSTEHFIGWRANI